MNKERIEEILTNTEYPRSPSVRDALLTLWDEMAVEYEKCIEGRREVDPYTDLKEAYENGETIQVYHITHEWIDITEGTAWLLPVDQYRIKPKTKKVKLLAYVDSVTGGLSYRFKHRNLKSNWKRAPQLDKHEIEVEE